MSLAFNWSHNVVWWLSEVQGQDYRIRDERVVNVCIYLRSKSETHSNRYETLMFAQMRTYMTI